MTLPLAPKAFKDQNCFRPRMEAAQTSGVTIDLASSPSKVAFNTLDAGDIEIDAALIPEPPTATLVGVGSIVLLALFKKHRGERRKTH